MRNKIFGILAVASVMVACSNDETLSVVSSEPITFGNTFVENSTRAIDNTYGDDGISLTMFNVYGTVTGNEGTVNIYNGDDVTATLGESTWSCKKVQYWVPNCTYNFMALVDATEGGNSVAVDEATDMPTSITYNVESQKDLLIATANRAQQETNIDATAVAFTFRHLLSKVQFTFTNGFPEDSGVELVVNELKITNAPQTGTYTIDNNEGSSSWQIDNSDTNSVPIDFGTTNSIKTKDIDGVSSQFAKVLLPKNEHNYKVTFTVTHNKGGDPTNKTFETGNIKLEPGHSYNFKANLSANNVSGVEPIKFVIITDKDWDSDDTTDKNVDY